MSHTLLSLFCCTLSHWKIRHVWLKLNFWIILACVLLQLILVCIRHYMYLCMNVGNFSIVILICTITALLKSMIYSMCTSTAKQCFKDITLWHVYDFYLFDTHMSNIVKDKTIISVAEILRSGYLWILGWIYLYMTCYWSLCFGIFMRFPTVFKRIWPYVKLFIN